MSWPNEYKLCKVELGSLHALIWLPINAANLSTFIDLDDDGKLWEVIEIRQKPVFDLARVKSVAEEWGELYMEGFNVTTS